MEKEELLHAEFSQVRRQHGVYWRKQEVTWVKQLEQLMRCSSSQFRAASKAEKMFTLGINRHSLVEEEYGICKRDILWFWLLL